MNNSSRTLVRIAAALVGLIATGAFVISYSALYSLALAANIVHPLAIIYPFLVDGFIVVASLAAFAVRGQPWKTTWYPWALLVVFFAFSVIGNAIHASARHGLPTLSPIAAAVVSAIPPIALGLAFHLLLRIDTGGEAPRPVATAQEPVNDTTLRDAAKRLIAQARDEGQRITGSRLATELGVSDRHGRRLLADLALNTAAEITDSR